MKIPLRLCVWAAVAAAPVLAFAAENAPAADATEALYVNLYDDAGDALARLAKHAEAGEWDKAAELAQKCIGEGRGRLFEFAPGLYGSFAEAVRRAVLGWPEAGLRAYRARCDAAAKALYERGVEARDLRELAEAADLYLPSSWGVPALAALADIHAERGELRAAERALERLGALAPAPDRRVAEKIEAVRKALDRDRSAGAGTSFQLGLPRWSFEVPEADVDQRAEVGLRARGLRVPRIIRPVAAGGRVFVQTTQWLAALDRETGELLWRFPQQPATPDSSRLEDAVLEPCVAGDRVFAFIAGKVTAVSAATGELAWAASDLAGPPPEKKGGDGPDPAGQPAEKKGGDGPDPADRPAEKKGGDGDELAPELLVNSLAAADGRVFACAAVVKQETESFVVALDARRGAILWRLKLGSQVFRGYVGRGSHPAPPACAEGVVYVSTNLGAVAAVDAATGEVRWLAKYNAFDPARRRVALRDDRCWENNAPLVCEGLVLAAPQDCDELLALDAATGRERWRAPRLDMRYLAGAGDGRAYVSGTRAAAVDLRTGKLAWLSDKFGEPAGRPTLAGAGLLVPTDDALVELAVKDGKAGWRYRLDDERERGNLVLAGNLLLSASFDRLDAWGDASDMPAGHEWHRAQRLDRLGDLAGALKLYRAALDSLDRADETEPALRAKVLAASSAAHARLGRQLDAAGDYASAREAFRLERDSAPTAQDAAAATFALAECREREGKWPAAIAEYQFAIQRQRGSSSKAGGVSLPAEAVAAAQIGRIIAQEGRAAYREQETAAAELLAAARDKKDAGLFAAVVARYPNSTAAEAARVERLKIPGQTGAERLALAWRTPFDTTRSAPVVVAVRPADAADDEAAFFVAAADLGDRRSLGWEADALECRRLRDGRLLWRTRVAHVRADAPLANGKLILRGVSELAALDPKTGRVLWATKRGRAEPPRGQEEKNEPPRRQGRQGELEEPRDEERQGGLIGRALEGTRLLDVVAGAGRVMAVTAGREVFAVDDADGKETWRAKLDGPALAGSACLFGGKLAVCVENPATVYWFDPKTGARVGKVAIEREDNRITDAPAVQAQSGRMAVVLGDREVRNLSLDTGKALWTAEMPFSIGRVAATPDGKHLVVFPDRWSFGGKMTCFEAATGKELWSEKPERREPGGVYVGDGMVVTARKGLIFDVLVAARIADGEVLWRSAVPVRPSVDAIADAGEFLLASGAAQFDLAGWQGSAALVRKSDGAVIKGLKNPGAGYSDLKFAAGTLLLCSNRGLEAYRMEDEGAAAVRLAALLDGRGPAGDAERYETARLLLERGEFEAAMALLDDSLLAEQPDPETFAAEHEQLMAIREASAQRRHAIYEAPRFARPPKIDGRLCEDWRRDRGAVLDRPRDIERVQFPLSPKRFWHGPNDLSAVLYVGWDEKNLYLAVDVSDDVHVTHDFDAEQWTGDCLAVAIDPECDGGYRLQGGDNLFWLALTAKQKRPKDDDETRLGGEHSIKIREDESGTVYELAIPWADVGIEQPRPGVRLGLDIMAIDDDGGPNIKAVSWTPGMTQNLNKDIMTRGIAPALFGTVILKER